MTDTLLLLDPKNYDVAIGNVPYQTPSHLRSLSNMLTLSGFGLIILALLIFLPFLIVSFSLGLALGFTVFVGLGIVLVIVGRVISQRERKLSKHGQVIYGTLTSISGYTDEGHFMVMLDYRFVTPQGREIEKGNTYRQQYIANHLANQPLPPVSTPVAIWYVDEKTYKLL